MSPNSPCPVILEKEREEERLGAPGFRGSVVSGWGACDAGGPCVLRGVISSPRGPEALA